MIQTTPNQPYKWQKYSKKIEQTAHTTCLVLQKVILRSFLSNQFVRKGDKAPCMMCGACGLVAIVLYCSGLFFSSRPFLAKISAQEITFDDNAPRHTTTRWILYRPKTEIRMWRIVWCNLICETYEWPYESVRLVKIATLDIPSFKGC